jgi:hypothetical protein
MVRTPAVWLLWAQYFLLTYPWYLYITWLTTYLLEHRKLSEGPAAVYAIFPLAFGGVGCVVSGFVLPLFARAVGGLERARRIVGCFGLASAGALIFVHTRTESILPAMLAMGFASFCNDLVMPCAWGTCMDVGGKYAGTLAGSMNMMGNFAGFTSPFVGGIIVQHSKSWVLPAAFGAGAQSWLHNAGGWNLYLYTFVVSYALGALCWAFLDSRHTLEKSARE